MFIDAPFLSIAADLRHRELLADAENFRLAKQARAARRATRSARRHEEPRPPEVRPPAPDVHPERKVDADRRYAVPR